MAIINDYLRIIKTGAYNELSIPIVIYVSIERQLRDKEKWIILPGVSLMK